MIIEEIIAYSSRFVLSLVFEMINQVKIPITSIRFNRINKLQGVNLNNPNRTETICTLFFFSRSLSLLCMSLSLFVHCLSTIYHQCICVCLYFARKEKKWAIPSSYRSLYVNSSMDELSLMIDTIIDNELDDLILDLVYDIHSSIKGIPDDQLDFISNSTTGNKSTKQFANTFSSFQTTTTAIEKQTCLCPHCGQSNIIAIRFAYHLAKCLGKEDKTTGMRRTSLSLSVQVLVDVHLVKQNIELSIK